MVDTLTAQLSVTPLEDTPEPGNSFYILSSAVGGEPAGQGYRHMFYIDDILVWNSGYGRDYTVWLEHWISSMTQGTHRIYSRITDGSLPPQTVQSNTVIVTVLPWSSPPTTGVRITSIATRTSLSTTCPTSEGCIETIVTGSGYGDLLYSRIDSDGRITFMGNGIGETREGPWTIIDDFRLKPGTWRIQVVADITLVSAPFVIIGGTPPPPLGISITSITAKASTDPTYHGDAGYAEVTITGSGQGSLLISKVDQNGITTYLGDMRAVTKDGSWTGIDWFLVRNGVWKMQAVADKTLVSTTFTVPAGGVIPSKWKCSGAPNYACTEDSTGTYNSQLECLAACNSDVVPTRYSCSGAPEYTCYEDPTGTYSTLLACQNACKDTTTEPPESPIMLYVVAVGAIVAGLYLIMKRKKSNGNGNGKKRRYRR